MPDKIIIRGAKVHNLKNVNIEIPKNKLVVVTGLSGSGKSSLAFDTIYAEGQRRYVESLSAYARQFMETRDRPDVDKIEGLSPTIAIDQKVSVQNPRSTVGTVTEIYDYLRLLYARVGEQQCPTCGIKTRSFSAGEIVELVRKTARQQTVTVLAPLLCQAPVVDAKQLLERVERSGYQQVRINGTMVKIHDFASYRFEPGKLYDVAIALGKIDDVKKQDVHALAAAALELGNGLLLLSIHGVDEIYSTSALCPRCKRSLPALDVRSFSFNSPYGACARCTGLGVTMEVDRDLVIPNRRLALAQGAIQPWTRITGNQAWYQKLLAAVAERHKFSLQTPVSELSEKIINLLFQGTGSEVYEIDGRSATFSGVAADLLKRHLETDSEYVRREIEQYLREQTCPVCHGQRLKTESLAVRLDGYNIAELSGLDIGAVKEVLGQFKLTAAQKPVADPVTKEIGMRLFNLQKVGLGYLSLDRAMNTLSGGEITRVRLAAQLSSGLTGVVYVLDEPSVGLHPRDINQLIGTLKYLRDLGNTVIVVEHDEALMRAADYLIDVGPGAGVKGGEIVAAGTLAEIEKSKRSLTGAFLSGRETVVDEVLGGGVGQAKKSSRQRFLSIIGAQAFNLKNIDVDIPLGRLTCVTGVSGSGKSTLVVQVLARALVKHFYRAKDEPGLHKTIRGVEHIDKIISIDQQPIGRTPRSNPATYTGIFTLIRDLFADLPEARLRGYDAGRFSFNVKGGGRCEACAGEGYVRIPMQFLADVFVVCNECGGSRYHQEVLEIHYQDKNIADVLRMTVEEAYKFFSNIPTLAEKLNVLRSVGLGYVGLGQPATTLSGGEAQRIKLATELARVSTGQTLYILDEPTTGLHFADIRRLLCVLRQLVAKGNTVVIIEHQPDVIRCSDWVVELGPGGGVEGGKVVVVGTPAQIKKHKGSWTGKYL